MLPLLNIKLPLSAFDPLIARIDRHLATWQAMLLSTAARVTLINLVLDGLPTYAMGAMMLPTGVVKKLDARQRAFLWAGRDTVSGALCLVAWEEVCKDKEDGGLGVVWLDTRNAYMLLKLLHKLHHPEGSGWASWVADNVELPDLSGELHGTHWKTLRGLHLAFRQITRVEIGDERALSTKYA